MMMNDMGKLYPDVRRKVTNNIDNAMRYLRTMYGTLDSCNYAMDFNSDFLYEFLEYTDIISHEFKKAIKSVEKNIPTLKEDELPPCPICGAKVRITRSERYGSPYHIECTECRYDLEGSQYFTSDETILARSKQTLMQTYIAETRRSEE